MKNCLFFVPFQAVVLAVLFLATTFIAQAQLLVKPGDKIAFLGDSITQGGWEMPGGYVKLTVIGLETLGAKVEPLPAGISGNTSRDMLNRLKGDVLDKKPDWMTLSCGVNDVWHGANGCTLEEFQKNITAIVDQAQAAGIKVLLLTATPIGEELGNDENKKLIPYNEFLRQLAAQRHLPLAEENIAFQDAIKTSPEAPRALTGDGVHPKSEGSIVMAKALLAGFGVTPAQIEQVQAAWANTPSTALVQCNFSMGGTVGLTLGQYTRLKALAAERKEDLNRLLDGLIIQATAEAIQAHRDDPVPERDKIQADAMKAFVEKLNTSAK